MRNSILLAVAIVLSLVGAGSIGEHFMIGAVAMLAAVAIELVVVSER